MSFLNEVIRQLTEPMSLPERLRKAADEGKLERGELKGIVAAIYDKGTSAQIDEIEKALGDDRVLGGIYKMDVLRDEDLYRDKQP